MENSIYLEDHTIGRAVSALDPGLAALPVVPLTFSMELMAEAAVIKPFSFAISTRNDTPDAKLILSAAGMCLSI